jgi:hypothetical protein
MICVNRINTPVYASNVSKTVRVAKPVGGKGVIVITSMFRAKEPTNQCSSNCNKRCDAPCSKKNPQEYVMYRDLMSAFHTPSVGETFTELEDGWVFTKTTKEINGFVVDFAVLEGTSVNSGRLAEEQIKVSDSNIVHMRAFMDIPQEYVMYRALMSAFHTPSVGETFTEFEDGWVFTKTTKAINGFVIDFAILEGTSVTSGRLAEEQIKVSGSNIVPMRAFMDIKQYFVV